MQRSSHYSSHAAPTRGRLRPSRRSKHGRSRPLGAALLRGGGRLAVVGAGLAVVAGAVTTLEGHDPAAAIQGAGSTQIALDGVRADAVLADAGRQQAAQRSQDEASRAAQRVALQRQAQLTATRKAAAAKAKAAADAKAARAKAARDQAARDQAAKAAAASGSGSSGSGSGSGSTRVSGGSPRAAAQAMLADYGWSQGQFSCLDSLWLKESDWNPYASNPSSGAYGIPQALPGGKMSSAGSDWRTNPVTQIRWGLGYIKSVYGTPCAAWGHSQAVNWY